MVGGVGRFFHVPVRGGSDVRGQQRLKRSAQPHSCGFITAVPSDEDGKDCLLRPRNFQIALAYRLGIPVLDKEIALSFVHAAYLLHKIRRSHDPP